MKTINIIVFTTASAAVVNAQQSIDSLPPCGKTCITNMIGKASDFTCNANDAKCLCSNPNFLYGVHDCSVQYCASQDDASQTIQFGNAYCKQEGVDTSTVTTGGGGASGTGAATTPGNATTPATTSTFTSTLVSSGVTTTTTGVSVVGGGSGPGTDTNSVNPTGATTITSGGSTLVTTVSSSTSQGGSGGTSTTTHKSSSSSGLGAQKTAAPVGMLAAAGLAAMLL